MAISRSQMNRQLRAAGGIMNVTPRENFGLGSSLKKFVRKIIPNEISDIAVKAAPYVAPFNPALAAAMGGIGTFDQTGSISAGLKSGAMNYGGGQLARYAGGAGFQGNPFGDGGAFTGGLQGFKAGFSSPIGTETGLGKFFSGRGTDAVQGVGPNEALASEVSYVPSGTEALASEVSYVPSGTEALASELSYVPNNATSALVDASDMQLVGDVKQAASQEFNLFKAASDKVKNFDYKEAGGKALELGKKFGKAAFTKPDGQGGTMVDKAAVIGAVAFAGSYMEAKALADNAGVELTEEVYDESRKAEKQEEYAGYLTNFFAGKKDGGRIGFDSGGNWITKKPKNWITKKEEDDDDDDDDDDDNEGIKWITKKDSSGSNKWIQKKADGGRIGYKDGTLDPINIGIGTFNPERAKELYENVKSIPGKISSISLEDIKETGSGLGEGIGSFYETAKSPIKALSKSRLGEETRMYLAYSELSKAQKQEMQEMGLDIFDVYEYLSLGDSVDVFKDGGRIGRKLGSPEGGEGGEGGEEDDTMQMASSNVLGPARRAYNSVYGIDSSGNEILVKDLYDNFESFLEMFKMQYHADGGRIGRKLGSPEEGEEGGVMEMLSVDVEANPDEDESIDNLMAGITFSAAEKSFLFKRLAGSGGASRSYTMPQLYKILNNPQGSPQDARALKQITIGLGIGKKDGGRIGYKGGANRVSELLVLRDEALGKGEDVSIFDAELFQLTGKTFRSIGGIGDIPTGQMRKNNVGVVERDYRDEGGFVPVGIKERADDVPAMLSKNEFVMTADAVRGIGNGSVEEGSKKLYNTMKQAEQKGKVA